MASVTAKPTLAGEWQDTVGTTQWAAFNNCLAEDGVHAGASLGAGEISYVIKAWAFEEGGRTLEEIIPPGAKITGVTSRVIGYKNNGVLPNEFRRHLFTDASADTSVESTPSSLVYPTSEGGDIQHKASYRPTRDEVVATGFGVGVSFATGGIGGQYLVDHLQLRIDFLPSLGRRLTPNFLRRPYALLRRS